MENQVETKKGNKLLLGIILGVVIGGLIFGGGTYYFVSETNAKDKENANVENNNDKEKEESNQNNEEDKKTGISGQYYLFEGAMQKRRYYLALDNAEYSNNVDFRTKKTYIVDMNLSDSQPAIKEIDLAGLLKPLYDKKINGLPATLAEGTTNAIPKSSCTSFPVSYFDAADAYMTDWTKEIAFKVYYKCMIGSGTEHSLGSELYTLNVENMKITHVGSAD